MASRGPSSPYVPRYGSVRIIVQTTSAAQIRTVHMPSTWRICPEVAASHRPTASITSPINSGGTPMYANVRENSA